MDASTFWTIVTAGLTLIGLITAVYFGTKSRPKKQLRYRVVGDRVVRGDVGGPLKVTFNDKPVTDPHIMRIRLTPTGRDDISSDDFDGGRPIVFDVGARILQITSTSAGNAPRFTIGGDEKSLEVAPDLFKAKQFGTSVVFVCDGPPKISASAHLIGAEVLPYRSNSAWQPMNNLWAVPAVFVFMSLSVAGLTVIQKFEPAALNGVLTAGYLGAGGLLVAAFGVRVLLRMNRLQTRLGTDWTFTSGAD